MWGLLRKLWSWFRNIDSLDTLIALLWGCCGGLWAAIKASPEDLAPYIFLVVGASIGSFLIVFIAIRSAYAGWCKWYQPKVDVTAYDGEEVCLTIRSRNAFSEGQCEVTGRLSGPDVSYRSPFPLYRGAFKAYEEKNVVAAEYLPAQFIADTGSLRIVDYMRHPVHVVRLASDRNTSTPPTPWVYLNVRVRFSGLSRSSDHHFRLRIVKVCDFEVGVVNTSTT